MGWWRIVKAITLTQPWATLVAIGAKRIETRNWSTKYRGPIAIHAAKSFPAWAKDLCYSGPLFVKALGLPDETELLYRDPKPTWVTEAARVLKSLPLGCVIAEAKIVHCLETEMIPTFVRPFTEQEKAFGDYSPGRFGFLFEDVVQLSVPMPAKGALSLWDWDPEVLT
jgi:hypothetical protein